MGELIDIAMTREEALKIVSNIYQTDKEKEALGVLIPELAESEDERIRRELVNFFQSPFIKENLTGEKVAPWIAYLEKLKEQKPVEIEEIIRKAKSEGRQEVIDNPEYYQLQKPASISCGHENDTEWSEEDKQWLSEVYSAIDHSMYSEVERQAMKKYIDHLRYQSQPKQELDEESSKVVLKAVELLNSYGNSLYNESFEKESNAVYKVADSLKLLSTQPKPEWSENEKQRLKTIAGYLRYKGYEEDACFLESIPPQQKEEGIKGVKGHPDPAGVWKPSDGQLKALKYFLGQHRLQMDASTTQWEEYDNLRSLYDILCKIAKS